MQLTSVIGGRSKPQWISFSFRFFSISLLLCALSQALLSQDREVNSDSLRLENLVMKSSGSDFNTSARALLLRTVRGYQNELGEELFRFMERRRGTKGWVTPDEEVLARLLLTNTAFLLDTNQIERVLGERLRYYGPHRIIQDDLYKGTLSTFTW